MAALSDNALWDFSVAVYGRAGVQEACLRLQDHGGLDVNVLLFCCWLAAEGHTPLSQTALSAAMAGTRAWQTEVVAALRAVRRRITDGVPPAPEPSVAALGEKILALELDGERIEQDILADAAPRAPDRPLAALDRPSAAAGNLAAYCRLAGVALEPANVDDLATILMAAFPSADRGALIRQIANA